MTEQEDIYLKEIEELRKEIKFGATTIQTPVPLKPILISQEI
jgi:hypothetical protein